MPPKPLSQWSGDFEAPEDRDPPTQRDLDRAAEQECAEIEAAVELDMDWRHRND